MMTKKQKSREIPFIEESIEELKHDMNNVQYAWTEHAIKVEIAKLELLLHQYRRDVE